MTQVKPATASLHELAKALARWDNEGGAPADRVVPHHDAEERILKCLGAAVIMQWNDLPTGIQRSLFEDAASISAPDRQFQLKQQIARFLHEHKDDA